MMTASAQSSIPAKPDIGRYTVGVVRVRCGVSSSSISTRWKSGPRSPECGSGSRNGWYSSPPARTLLTDGADEANLSSAVLSLDVDLIRENPFFSAGGRIKEGGELGGDAEGFVVGEQGAVCLHMLIVAARGLSRDSVNLPYREDPCAFELALIEAINKNLIESI